MLSSSVSLCPMPSAATKKSCDYLVLEDREVSEDGGAQEKHVQNHEGHTQLICSPQKNGGLIENRDKI